MPFDIGDNDFETTTPNEIYRLRREGAAKIWAAVPKEVFDMDNWSCGTKACALGWLAREKYDGWEWRGGVPRIGENRSAYVSAAQYFGISLGQAHACFAGYEISRRFHGKRFWQKVQPSDVAKTLLTLPYPESRKRSDG